MTPSQAYNKCLDNNKRDKELEPIIIKDPESAYLYARFIIRGRWIEAEDIISADSKLAFWYAQLVIKGRWKEAEDIIATDPRWAYLYAHDIIGGKLPENMHNMMLLHALKADQLVKIGVFPGPDYWAKEYFIFIKYNPVP